MLSDYQLKYFSLALLTVQTAVFVLMANKSRIPDKEGHLYRTSTAVFVLELSKFIVSALVLSYRAVCKAHGASKGVQYHVVSTEDSEDIRSEKEVRLDSEALMEGVSLFTRARREMKAVLFNESGIQILYPATAFAIQNLLQLRAATYLQPAVFQVFNQAKMFTTAIFAYFLLKKKLSLMQWISLFALGLGIVVVQLSSKGQVITIQDPADLTLGFILMMIVAFFSGFGSVFTEALLKKGNDFWATNAQMAAFSLAPAVVMVLVEGIYLKSFNIFEYFGGWALSTVLMNAAGGIVVSTVIKYADSILKGFAIAAAILLTVIINVMFLGAHFSLAKSIGIVTVLCSIFLYSASSLFSREQPSIQSVKINMSSEGCKNPLSREVDIVTP